MGAVYGQDGGAGVSESKTSVRRLEAIERQRQALELRLGGASYAAIASALGYASTSGAVKAIDSAINRTLEEPAEKVRKLELRRLDAMLLALWPKVKNGDEAAITAALRVMHRRAQYLGLDAPTKIDLVEYTREQARHAGLTDDDVEAAVRFVEDQVRGA